MYLVGIASDGGLFNQARHHFPFRYLFSETICSLRLFIL